MPDETSKSTPDNTPGNALTQNALLGETYPPFVMMLFLGTTSVTTAHVCPEVRWHRTEGKNYARIDFTAYFDHGFSFDRIGVMQAGDELWARKPRPVAIQPGDSVTLTRSIDVGYMGETASA